MSDDLTHPDPPQRRLPAWMLPVVGGLAGMSLGKYLNLFGDNENVMGIIMFLIIGSAAGRVLTFFDAADGDADREATPNPRLTKALLAVGVLLFWVPVGGLALISYAIYRTRWLREYHLMMFPLCCLFLVSLAVTIVTGLIVSMEAAGLR